MKFWKTVSEIKSKEGDLHFKRFCYFSCKWFGIYKHIIVKPDEDKHDHDHPWDFLSIVLEGSYADMVNGWWNEHRKPLSIKFNKAEYHHKLMAVQGPKNRCVTLVITGPRRREWGYVTNKGKYDYKDGSVTWVDNKEYRRMKKGGEL